MQQQRSPEEVAKIEEIQKRADLAFGRYSPMWTDYVVQEVIKLDAAKNTKHAGDVKRWTTNEEAVHYDCDCGEWVRFADIAHLLKPQEPEQLGIKLTMQEVGLMVSEFESKIEKLNSQLNRALEGLGEANKTLWIAKERIEKLEGENRRLMAALEKIIKADQVLYQERRNERMVEIANEALNSGGVE